MSDLAQIGVTGLAVMGRNLARNFARNGYTVAIHNRSYAKTHAPPRGRVRRRGHVRAERVDGDFVASLARPRAVIIMVKAGEPHRRGHRRAGAAAGARATSSSTPATRTSPTPSAASRPCARRACTSSARGVSGGEEGALLGPSIMPGGSEESYETLGPILEKIAAKVDGTPVLHPHRPRRRRPLREDGPQRHRVRRHAAHRRGVRPAARRGSARRRPRSPRSSASGTPATSSRSSSRSPPTSSATSTPTTGKAFVDIVAGPGRAEGHRPLDRAERPRPRRADHRHRRGDLRPRPVRPRRRSAPPPAPPSPSAPAPVGRPTATPFIEDVRLALYASKVVAYSQGFDQIAAGSDEFGWDIDRGAIATIWRGGCIIRARFLNRITEAYERERAPAAPAGRRVLHRRGRQRRRVLAPGRRRGCRRPASRRRRSRRRSRTTTGCAPSGCPPR